MVNKVDSIKLPLNEKTKELLFEFARFVLNFNNISIKKSGLGGNAEEIIIEAQDEIMKQLKKANDGKLFEDEVRECLKGSFSESDVDDVISELYPIIV